MLLHTHLVIIERLKNKDRLNKPWACCPVVRYSPCTGEIRVRFSTGPLFSINDLVNIHKSYSTNVEQGEANASLYLFENTSLETGSCSMK